MAAIVNVPAATEPNSITVDDPLSNTVGSTTDPAESTENSMNNVMSVSTTFGGTLGPLGVTAMIICLTA